MKELSIEEKAKRYDEAIKVAKSNYEIIVQFDKDCTFAQEAIINTFHHMFPELKESEDENEDERIKRDIIETLRCGLACEESILMSGATTTLKEATAWLEKQGEQKPTDKVEPKFNVGDWVVYHRNNSSTEIMSVYDIRDNRYYFNDNIHFSWSVKECDEKCHLWTIQDAKDGDVISFNDGHGNDCIELIKSITNKKIEFWFCLTNGNSYEVFDGIIPYTNLASRKGAILATQEQRDTLFAKIKEAGYEWDAEKKELKKINSYCKNHCKGYQETGKCFVDGGCKTKRDEEQNPAWSEENNSYYDDICEILINLLCSETANINKDAIQKDLDWLMLLKIKNTWKPTDKQIKCVSNVVNAAKYKNDISTDGYEPYTHLSKLLQQLKKLREE